MITDRIALVRREVLQGIHILYTTNNGDKIKSLFTSKFLPRFIEMTNDVNEVVVCQATNILTILFEGGGMTQESMGELDLDEALDGMQDALFDHNANLREASARFVSAQYPDYMDLENNDAEGDEVEDEEDPAVKETKHANQMGVMLNMMDVVDGSPSYIPNVVDAFWRVRGCSCLHNIALQMKTLAMEDDEDQEDESNERDTTLYLYILQECVNKQIGIGTFSNESQSNSTTSRAVSIRSRFCSDLVSKRLLEGLPLLLTKFSDNALRIKMLSGLVTRINPDVLGSINNTKSFRSLLKQLRKLYLRFGSSTCVDSIFRKSLAGSMSYLGGGPEDNEEEEEEDDEKNLVNKFSQINLTLENDLKLQEMLVGEFESDAKVVENLAAALQHLSTASSTSTKREAGREIKQLSKEICTKLNTHLQQAENGMFDEMNDDDDDDDFGDNATKAKNQNDFQIALSLHRMSALNHLSLGKHFKIPQDVSDKIHTLIEKEMTEPHSISECNAASVVYSLKIGVSNFWQNFYSVFNKIRRERGEESDDEEEDNKKSKKSKTKGKNTKNSKKSQDEEEDNEEEDNEEEEDEDDVNMSDANQDVEETEEERIQLDLLIQERDTMLAYAHSIFQNYLEVIGDAKNEYMQLKKSKKGDDDDDLNSENDEDDWEDRFKPSSKKKVSNEPKLPYKDTPEVVRMRVICEHTYKITMDIMTCCTVRLSCENSKLRRLAYTPTPGMTRLVIKVFDNFLLHTTNIKNLVLQQEIDYNDKKRIEKEHRQEREKEREEEEEEDEDEDDEDQKGSKKSKSKSKTKKTSSKNAMSEKKNRKKFKKLIKIPMPASSAKIAFDQKVTEEIILPLYRWFQFSAKFQNDPNLDIGGMLFRQLSHTKNNGPRSQVAKHYVKFLLEDHELKLRGKSSKIIMEERQKVENGSTFLSFLFFKVLLFNFVLFIFNEMV